MKKKVCIAVLFYLYFVSSFTQAQKTDPNNIIYIKLSSEITDQSTSRNTVVKWLKRYPLKQINPISDFIPEQRKSITISEKYTHLYRVVIDDNAPTESVIRKMQSSGMFQYIIPNHTFDVMHIPNDAFADSSLAINSGQNQLLGHNFYEAWKITKGDTNVVIGVVDTGTNLTHEDLTGNLKYNYNDPINELNDDGDFFINIGNPLTDNFHGWDLADWDNNPSFVGNGNHGAKVIGVAAATANNEVGLAGTGYNTKYIPYKAAPDVSPNSITHGYDGLLMAGLQGCGIINLSWGAPITMFNDELLENIQDLINLVAIDLDAVIVSASGNTNTEVDYIPAALDNVISVTSIRVNDNMKDPVGSFSTSVDIAAIGRNVRTVDGFTNSDYKNETGTSMAAPLVSGAAGLVRAQFPDLTAQQVIQQLRVSGDVIDTLEVNSLYKEKIGRKLNPYKAVTETSLPAIRNLDNISFSSTTGNMNSFVSSGDTIEVYSRFVNYLASVDSVRITLSVVSDNAKATDSVFYIKNYNTYDSVFNQLPLKIYVNPSTVAQRIKIRFGIDSEPISDYHYRTIRITPEVISSQSASLLNDNNINAEVFPNPFTNEVEFFIPNNNTSIYIKDITGKIIDTYTYNKGFKKCDLSDLSMGLYFISFVTSNGQEVIKVQKL